MESALSMGQRQQETPCPEVTLNSDDQMDVIHEKCNRLRIPTENTDNLPNLHRRFDVYKVSAKLAVKIFFNFCDLLRKHEL